MLSGEDGEWMGREEKEGRLQGNRASRPAGNLKWPASPTWTSRTDTKTNIDTNTDTNTDTDRLGLCCPIPKFSN